MTARVAVTTIVRRAPLETPSGWLRVIDIASGEQLAMAPVPDALHRARDRNPRGGMRGGRGIAVTPERLAFAINDRVLVLDAAWSVRGVLSHRWMGGLHDLAADGGGIWAACSDNDLVLRIDWDGRLIDAWHWRADRGIRRALGHKPLPRFDTWADHRDPRGGGARFDVGHVNSVALDGDRVLVGLGLVRPWVMLWHRAAAGRVLRLASRAGLGFAAEAVLDGLRRLSEKPGGPASRSVTAVAPGAIFTFAEGPPGASWAIVELSEARENAAGHLGARLVAQHPASGRPAHNLVPCDGLIAVADSPRGTVLGIDRGSGAVVRTVQLPGDHPFPRGMLRLDDGRLAVGTQEPAALTVVDLEAERVCERILLPDDRGESPFAIAPVPAGFEHPAGRLPETRAGWGIVGADASAG